MTEADKNALLKSFGLHVVIAMLLLISVSLSSSPIMPVVSNTAAPVVIKATFIDAQAIADAQRAQAQAEAQARAEEQRKQKAAEDKRRREAAARKARQEKAAKEAPIENLVSIEQIGDAAAFLVSEHSKHITGQTIYIDNGYNVLG